MIHPGWNILLVWSGSVFFHVVAIQPEGVIDADASKAVESLCDELACAEVDRDSGLGLELKGEPVRKQSRAPCLSSFVKFCYRSESMRSADKSRGSDRAAESPAIYAWGRVRGAVQGYWQDVPGVA